MQCPMCGGAKLIHDTRDISYTYKGEQTLIPSVTGDFCPACSEVIMEPTAARRFSRLIRKFDKQVNAAFVNPEFIVEVREKLDLDQKQAAKIFGGGANAFSRYENGRTKPPLALVQLLRVLDRHPDLLAEIKQHTDNAATHTSVT